VLTEGSTRSVRLTARGRRSARRAAEQRAAYLNALLDGLTPTEVQTLHDLLTRLMTEGSPGSRWR